MRLCFVLLIISLQISVFANAQKITLSRNHAALAELIKEIKKQSGYNILYDAGALLGTAEVSINVRNVSVSEALDQCLKGLPLAYVIDENNIIISKRDIPQARQTQTRRIAGTVTNRQNEPLEGATVSVKGTAIVVTTDANGKFVIENLADGELTLSFTMIGYNPSELKARVSDRSLTVKLDEQVSDLDEVVVVGYGTAKKADLTGAVSSISSSELENKPITQASQALAGLASGITVSQSSGRPGNDGSTVTIRGMGTFSDAGNSPLVLIDGLAASMDDVDPNNIKSISVLKDAASASIYGTRAANGVILIETKRGQSGQLRVSYNNYVGWQKVTELPQFLDSWEFATLKNEANANMGQGRAYSDEEIEKFRTGSDPDNYPNVPHLKNMLTSGSGFQTNHNLNFMGGSEKNTYSFSVGYLRQDGVVAQNDYTKYNFLLNSDSKIKDNLTLKVNLSGNARGSEEPRHQSGDMMNMIGFAVREGPIFAGKKSDGTYGYQDNYSPEAWMDSESFNKNKDKMFLGGAELAWEIIKGLTWSGKVGYNYNNYTDDSYLAEVVFDQYKTVGPNSLSITSGDNHLLTLQSLLDYTKSFGQHNLHVLAGFSEEEYREDWITAFRDNFPNNSLYELNAGSSSNMQSSGSASEWALRSYFGRVNYDYKERYLLEVNARYDGTSRFPQEGRWGLFPSVSAGWRISEESFIKDNLPWINNLKIRASWGKLGNQNIGNYPYQNVLALDQNYSFGGTLASGARLTTLANADIHWETTRITDVGLDITLFGNKLDVVMDYFDKVTSDILYDISVSQVLGLTPSSVNAGEVRNRGGEISMNYKASIGQFNLSVRPNFSFIKNEVTKLANVQKDIAKGLFVGQPLNSIYGYVADGLFVDQSDIDNYPTQPYAAEPGFVRYSDISGPDGVPDGKVDATYDRKVIGTTFPKYSYGMTLALDYKGIDFSVLFQGLAGFDKQMTAYEAIAFNNNGQIQRWQADNRWTTDNPDPNAKYIKLTNQTLGSGTTLPSTYWNRNASFLRLKNLQLGYSFSNEMLKHINISRLRVFFSGQNLLLFNHFYEGWDPESSSGRSLEVVSGVGSDNPFYPISSVYSFGVNLTF